MTRVVVETVFLTTSPFSPLETVTVVLVVVDFLVDIVNNMSLLMISN